MKRYFKELIILLLQIFMFYIFPLFAGPTDTFGMVILMIISTWILSVALVLLSKETFKYLYPLVVALLFIPSIYIYYNESALIHSVWYFVVSSIGILFGALISGLFKCN